MQMSLYIYSLAPFDHDGWLSVFFSLLSFLYDVFLEL
jgi:hypothetical protein